MNKKIGQNNSQILENYRQFTKSYIEQFKAERDRVFKLLGSTQQYSSGTFREGLFRTFLENILPSSISVNSGFIYGFEVENNSKQLDVIIWDSSRYGVIYKTKEYVIVAPESVIAIITVKTNMKKCDIESALDNLDSIINLDRLFRRSRLNQKTKKNLHKPIAKYFMSYNPPNDPIKAGLTISEHYKDLLLNNQQYANEIINALKNIDPINPSNETQDVISTIMPRMIFSIESPDSSYLTGWGPPDDLLVEKEFGDEKVKRLPYLYKQKNKITTQLDKFVGNLISLIYKYLDTPGWTTSAAWADIHPMYGFRMGDSGEIDEENSWAMIDANNTKYKEIEKNTLLPEGWI